MQYAGRRTEVRRTKVRGRKYVDGSSTDESSWTEVRRKLDGSLWTKVRRHTSDESWAEVWRKFDLRRTCKVQPPLRWWRATVLHCSSSQRCNDGRECCSSQRCYGASRQRAAACSILATLLQQRAGPCSVAAMASNAALLRQHVGPCNVAAMAGNALDLATVLRWPTTHWTLQRCCNVRQRATTPANAVLQRFCLCFFFFTPDNLKREKEWEKERSFDTCSLVSRLRLSQ